MDEFEALLASCRDAVERFVKFRLDGRADAEDVLQEVYFSAYRNFDRLKDAASFKSWLLSIARNKCNDYYRIAGKRQTVSLEEIPAAALPYERDSTEGMAVQETMEQLPLRDRQMLHLYFWQELPQTEIAYQLGIPLGTVKSRLHHAKKRFRDHYPYLNPKSKGEKIMGKLPEIMPDYIIEKSALPPFAVRWDEVMGWFVRPQIGEKLTWAEYDYPDRIRKDLVFMEVTGRVRVHGIEGVEIVSQTDTEGGFRFVIQQTDTHCRYLAESHMVGGVRQYNTFLDGEGFLKDWGFGPDNCGNEIQLCARGRIRIEDGELLCDAPEEALDILERCSVIILGKTYDTVRLFYLEGKNGVASEQYLDRYGRTILWRRFNRDDWAVERYGCKLWSEQLPGNEQLTINGETYVHWYDCITDYIL